jgi:hypothetical protein
MSQPELFQLPALPGKNFLGLGKTGSFQGQAAGSWQHAA